MDFKVFGKEGAPTLMLIPGLGVSYEIFLPLVDLLKDKYRIIAVQVDGFTLGVQTEFTSIDDQAEQVIVHIKDQYDGRRSPAPASQMAGGAAPLLPVRQCLDLLSLDGVLALGVPLSLFRRTAGRMPVNISVRRRTCRARRLQVRLYQ